MVSRVVLVRRVLKDRQMMDMPVFVSPAILVQPNGTVLLLVWSVRARLQVSTRIIVVRMLVVIQQHLEMALYVLAMKVLLVLLERTSARHVWRPRAMVWTVVLVLSVARAPQAMDTSVCVMKHISTM
jgi:hypothetical protein